MELSINITVEGIVENLVVVFFSIGIRSEFDLNNCYFWCAPVHKLTLLILQVTTYRGLPDGNLAVLQAYIDADVSSITISRIFSFLY